MKNSQFTMVFVFGTLRDEDVLRVVLGRELPSSCRACASLADHCRLMLHDETYPVLAHMAGDCVPGQLLALNEQDMSRVRFFEADEYEFEAAQVRDVSGNVVDALLCAERATRPGPRYPWSLRRWQREHKSAFLIHAQTYMNLYGKSTVAQADVVWKGLVGRV